MGLKNDTRTIEGIEIRTVQLPALRALQLSAKLGKVIAPVLDKLGGLSMSSDIDQLTPALTELFGRMDGPAAEALVCECLAASSAIVDDGNGKGPRLIALNNPSAINTVFNGKLRAMLSAVMFVIEVNFADFFDGAPAGTTPPPVAPTEPANPSSAESSSV